MTFRRIMTGAAAVLCVAAGFALAWSVSQQQGAQRLQRAQELHAGDLTRVRDDATQWASALATAQGEAVLNAFVAGIAPAVQAQRQDSIETAAVNLLRVKGVMGVHLLGPDDAVRYSSDAKLATTGELGPRGIHAAEVTQLITRPGIRPGVLNIAMPVGTSDEGVAVAWLEFDATATRDAARPADWAAP